MRRSDPDCAECDDTGVVWVDDFNPVRGHFERRVECGACA